MSKQRKFRHSRRAFEEGRLTRRAFLQSAAALGIAATAPLALGSRHAAAQTRVSQTHYCPDHFLILSLT